MCSDLSSGLAGLAFAISVANARRAPATLGIYRVKVMVLVFPVLEFCMLAAGARPFLALV